MDTYQETQIERLEDLIDALVGLLPASAIDVDLSSENRAMLLDLIAKRTR
jgi:hypothetical protein